MIGIPIIRELLKLLFNPFSCVSIPGLGEKKYKIHKPNSMGLAPSRHIEGDTE